MFRSIGRANFGLLVLEEAVCAGIKLVAIDFLSPFTISHSDSLLKEFDNLSKIKPGCSSFGSPASPFLRTVHGTRYFATPAYARCALSGTTL